MTGFCHDGMHVNGDPEMSDADLEVLKTIAGVHAAAQATGNRTCESQHRRIDSHPVTVRVPAGMVGDLLAEAQFLTKSPTQHAVSWLIVEVARQLGFED